MTRSEHVARMGEIRNSYKILFGKREGKRPLGKPRQIWKYNIRMNHTGGSSGLAFVSAVMNLRISYKLRNFLNSSLRFGF
jgi:hypothetical protein